MSIVNEAGTIGLYSQSKSCIFSIHSFQYKCHQIPIWKNIHFIQHLIPKINVFKWSVRARSCSYSTDRSKTKPFHYQSLKCLDFEWILNLNVRYSSPHCIFSVEYFSLFLKILRFQSGYFFCNNSYTFS